MVANDDHRPVLPCSSPHEHAVGAAVLVSVHKRLTRGLKERCDDPWRWIGRKFVGQELDHEALPPHARSELLEAVCQRGHLLDDGKLSSVRVAKLASLLLGEVVNFRQELRRWPG